MAARRKGGGFRGEFNNRGQFRAPDGQQVKVNTANRKVMRVRPGGGQFKRVPCINRKKGQETYLSD